MRGVQGRNEGVKAGGRAYVPPCLSGCLSKVPLGRVCSAVTESSADFVRYPATIPTPAAPAARSRSASVVANGKLSRIASAKYAAS